MTMRLWLIAALLVASLTFLPRTQGQDISAAGADLYYLSVDAGGVIQVFQLAQDGSVTQLTSAASSVLAYDVAYDGTLAYTTGRELVVGEGTVSTGGALDNANIQVVDVDWSPNADRVAAIALNTADAADPAEGLWFYTLATQTWDFVVASVRGDVPEKAIFTGVDWSPAGDRLILDARFQESDAGGIALYSLNTANLLPMNIAGTNNLINAQGYSQGSWALDGTDFVLSDVPFDIAQVGNGFILDSNQYTRLIPVADPGVLASRYLSHATPILNGTAFFIRDFGNNITTTEVWHLGNDGARVALGNLPFANIVEAAWTTDGNALLAVTETEDGARTGNLFVRVGDVMEAVPLPEGVSRMNAPQWGAQPLDDSRPNDLVFSEPLLTGRDAAGAAQYSVNLQWQAVPETENYRVTVEPGISEQTAFDVASIAAQLRSLACGVTYNISVAAIDASGNAGESSFPATLTTPPCELDLQPLNQPAGAAPAESTEAAPTEAAPEATAEAEAGTETETTTTTGGANPALPPLSEDPGSAEPVGDPASLVLDFAASEPTPAADGASYSVNLTWTSPSASATRFLVIPFPRVNDSPAFPASASEINVTRTIEGLLCGGSYNFRVQTLGQDGTTSLATTAPITVTTPACPG